MSPPPAATTQPSLAHATAIVSLSEIQRHNKGLAFTEKERDAHYLRGLLPPAIFTQELQVWNHKIDNERGLGKNKRKWNDLEDEKLVEAMIDVINSGSQFKSDNGFKPGFLNAVEHRLAVLLPSAGIKAKPHIESRIKTLKSDWSAVHDMLSWKGTSSFGWDYENSMVEAPQSVWQEYGQVHKNAAKWRGKKFTHYYELCLVFGKDRANGRDAQTAADVISKMDTQQNDADHTQGNVEGLEEIHVDHAPNSPLNAPLREESSSHRKRKRKNSWDSLVNSLDKSVDVIGSKLEEATKTFNSVLGIERDREELRKCNKAVRMLSHEKS